MNLLCSLFAAITIGSTSLPTNYKQVETKAGAQAPKVEVDASPKNEVYAKAFVSEEEELRVIIVGMGGKTSATITVDDKGRKLSSKYGLTEWVAPGKYKFLTDKVNSDILY